MTQEKFIAEIIKAIGKSKRFTDKQKFDFALCLSEDILYEIYDAKDRDKYVEIYQKLKDSTLKLEIALKKYRQVFEEAQQAFSFPFTPLGYLSKRYTQDWGLDETIQYYENKNDALATKAVPPEHWPPHRDIVSYLVAKRIADEYLRIFGSISTGKGGNDAYGKPQLTPYDRVCNVVEKHYKINLTSYIISQAARAARTAKVARAARDGVKLPKK